MLIIASSNTGQQFMTVKEIVQEFGVSRVCAEKMVDNFKRQRNTQFKEK